jgi:hypothetical protein
MEMTVDLVDLKESAIHDKGFSFYNHNYYKLKTPIFGMDYIKVIYYEAPNGCGVKFGELIKGTFFSRHYFDADLNATTLTIYLE